MKHAVTVEGKTILITGGCGLIGKTISASFLEQGASVIITDINKEALSEIQNEYSPKYGIEKYVCFYLDIKEEKSCSNLMHLCREKFESIDILINNAAIDAKFDKENISSINSSRFEYYPIDVFRSSVDVNITGTIIITQHVIRQMLLQGYGNIINVASIYSLVAPNQSLYDFGDGNINYKPVDYVASKSFIPNFTRYIATVYAKENIRCNAIAPHGIFNGHDDAFIKNFAKLSPIGRMCNKEELAGPFTFLASDASSYMTGSILTVDGGWTAW